MLIFTIPLSFQWKIFFEGKSIFRSTLRDDNGGVTGATSCQNLINCRYVNIIENVIKRETIKCFALITERCMDK